MIEKYWWDNYGRFGKRSEDFIEGVIAGVKAFAVWKDGREVVGVLQRPLEEVIDEIRSELEIKRTI